MTNIELLKDIKDFYSLCVRSGWCRVTRYQDITQLWIPVHGRMGHDGLKHSFKIIPMNLGFLHWVDPHTSGKLVNMIEEIETYLDKAYISLRPACNGRKYIVEAFNVNGKCIKKWVLKLFYFPPLHILILDGIQRFMRWVAKKKETEAKHKEPLNPKKLVGL